MKIDKEKMKKILFVLGNIALVFICFIVIFLILQFKNTLYEKNNELLYKVINKTDAKDKYLAFKGDIDNNYLVYNNLLWRIIRVNSSGTITLVLDSPITMLPWEVGEDFSLSDYLEKEFKEELDLSKLAKNLICSDIINDLSKVTCKNIQDNYVSLLDLNSYISTIENGKTFIGTEESNIWLVNEYDEENAWHITEGKISHSTKEFLYEVRPVITLDNDIIYENGNGTKEDPYMIASKEITIGSKVKLGNDLYDVVSTKDNIKLVLKENLEKKYQYTGDYEDLVKYLEEEFYNKLSYKDIIMDNKWQLDEITNGKISTEKITSKVGVLSIFDFKVSDISNGYLLSSIIDNHFMIYDNPMIYGTKGVKHSLRPSIVLDKDKIDDFKLEDGAYVLGDL